MMADHTPNLLRRLWQAPALRLAASALILFLILSRLPLSDLARAMGRVSVGVWAASLSVVLLGHVANVIKWSLLINIEQGRLPVLTALRCHFAGIFANLLLPSAAGGDVIRAGMAIRLGGVRDEVIVGSLLDRALDAVSLLLLAVGGALTSPDALAQGRRQGLASVALLAACALAGCACLVFVRLPTWLPERLRSVIHRGRVIIEHLASHPRRALAGAGISVAVQGTFVLLNAGLGSAIGMDLPLRAWFLAWPLAKLFAMLPVSIGGIGVREAALATLLGEFGAPAATAVGLGLLWETMFVATAGIGAVFYLLSRRDRVGVVDGE
jgi:uncharacterized membrane protein YbhN (UPF0104 family)